jgi:hypothetical protein
MSNEKIAELKNVDLKIAEWKNVFNPMASELTTTTQALNYHGWKKIQKRAMLIVAL